MKKIVFFILFLASSASYSEESKIEVPVLKIISPVQGTFITPNSPGTRIPSHGTAGFGEEYAIDFVMVPPSGTSKKPYAKSLLEYLVRGLPLDDFYGYGQAVRSPISGEVVACENSIPERDPVNIARDVAYAKQATRNLIDNNAPPTSITGNYVLIKGEGNVYLLLTHLRPGTVTVRPGQKIAQGETVGQLGHSGNSTMPHLHMQFMDSADYKVAHGIPFAFRDYDVTTKNGWRRVSEGLPTDSDIVRF